MQFPKTKKEAVVENIHGYEIVDFYRWLEDGKSSEVKVWVEEQNTFLRSLLPSDKIKNFSDELLKNFEVTNFSNLFPCKGKYFYGERKPGENQFVQYVKNGLNGEPKELINPNKLSNDGTITVDFHVVSRSGKYVAYGLSKGGDEMATLYIKDVETGQDLIDKIERCRYSQVRWLPDDSGFFYTRNPRAGEVSKNEEHLHVKVYFHKIGDDPVNDKFIFGENRDDMLGLSLAVDGKHLAITVAQSWFENDVFIYEVESGQIKPLIIGLHAEFRVFFTESKILLLTNYRANNYRVLGNTIDRLFCTLEEWSELIPESSDRLEELATTKECLIVVYLHNVSTEIKIFDYNGQWVKDLDLPPHCSLSGIANNRLESEFFYGVQSFTFPHISYRFDPDTKLSTIYRQTDNPINPDDYTLKQEWLESKDGVKVPVFIFHKKTVVLNGSNPTILYGYGGFGSNETPSFMRGWIPWLERGGVFVSANIRGGSEFGEKWHRDGIKDKKQNSFDDFISAAEYLIHQKYTSKKHLGILGGSNGGLLVSAVATQRPDLFKAVCSRVPLTDMVRFPLFGIASRWIHEYGDPSVKEDLEKILNWSPYHNVKEGVEHPVFLFTTADQDTRVDPLHARKMAAALQAVNKDNPILLLTEFNAGHGPGKPISKIVESQSITLSFFTEQLGLEV